MIKNNKLTLKALKQELELLKSSKSKAEIPITNHKASVAHDIKNSYIQNLHMKSSMFMLWLITAVLSYAHKIPFIGKIITLASFYYGRTTIWKVLVKLRKLFIAFNAVIGVYMVFKTTGFSSDNILAGFAGMGHTYLEIFINFTKRLFHWFFDLFDHKIVPNVPSDKPSIPKNYPWSGGKIWGYNPPSSSNSILPDFSLRELYAKNSLFNINLNPTPWYRDISTWVWFAGIIGGVGILVLTYKFISDPTFIHNYFSKSDGPITKVTGASPEASGSDIGLDDIGLEDITSKGKGVYKSLTFILTGVRKLNPYNWFLTASEFERQHRAFMVIQSSENYDARFYPFTEVNPYFNWFHRMRISWLGETTHEIAARRFLKSDILDGIMSFGKNHSSPIASTSGTLTPTSVGIGMGVPSGSAFLDTVTLSNKLSSLPATPTGLSIKNLPDTGSLEYNPFNDKKGDAIDRLVNVTKNVINSLDTDDITPPKPSINRGSYAWVLANKGKHK